MVKFVLDADASIKLAKAGVLEHLTLFAKCFVSKQVYDEVLKGRDRMYEDAFEIERLSKKGNITLSTVEYEKIEGLGAGECSTLVLFKKSKAHSILSDDRKFLSVLLELKIPFIIPTDIIAMLFIKRRISRIEAIGALDRIRQSVREESYISAIKTMRGK